VADVLIALGSNVGDRAANLTRAVEALRQGVEVIAVSRIYETAPMYVTDQPPFLNAAVRVRTCLGPLPVLKFLKATEASIGRQARERNGPREIDLDLIAYGTLAYTFRDGTVRLQVPHPRAHERRFVMAPLADIAANDHMPGIGRIRELLEATNEQAETVQVHEHAVLPL
jgi:2-amino-4-hydroxy-6-hydroxymethyldihydropteridine diphosphokinase